MMLGLFLKKYFFNLVNYGFVWRREKQLYVCSIWKNFKEIIFDFKKKFI